MLSLTKWSLEGEVIDWKEFREKAKRTDLPILIDTSDLAENLGVRAQVLTFLLTVQRSIVIRKTIEKQSGRGTRELVFPNIAAIDKKVAQGACLLKHLHKTILYNLLQNFKISEAAYGFIDGKDVIKCATTHIGKDVVVAFDIKDFFPTTTRAKVRDAFRDYAPWSSKVIWILTELLTYNGHIPQGFSTSPMVSNIIMYPIDESLKQWAASNGWTYTRYADDLIFSKNGKPLRLLEEVEEELEPLVNGSVETLGYTIKGEKTKVMPKPGPQRVLGIVVNDKLNLERKRFDLLKAKVHNAHVKRRIPADVIFEFGQGDRNAILKYLRKLQGEVTWAERLNPEKVKKIKRRILEVMVDKNNYKYVGPVLKAKDKKGANTGVNT